MSRRPWWACADYETHGGAAVCGACQDIFRRHKDRDRAGLPPRAVFGRGWFSVGATHWFAGSPATVFTSGDGKRVLAQAACGGICDVTLAYVPGAGNECRKCVSVLDKLGMTRTGRA